jgi:formamidopyrimidine-DNA glycosylase
MTGAFLVKGEPVPSYKSFKCDSSWPPRFCKAELFFSGGGALAFCDPRRLGRICTRPADKVLTLAPISKLGRDPLIEGVDREQLTALLASRSLPVKALLLDQEVAFSGIGNWVADEVCYQARIHPSQPCNSIEKARVEALADAIENICTTASQLLTASKDFPKEWLFHYRWAKGKQDARDHFGNKISFETCGGRTSAVVLALQKKTATSAVVSLQKKTASKKTASKNNKRKRSEESNEVLASSKLRRKAGPVVETKKDLTNPKDDSGKKKAKEGSGGKKKAKMEDSGKKKVRGRQGRGA